jgi:hypothetical protein
MTKLLGIVVAALLLGGCMFPQGWHWPRTGTNTTETVIYVAARYGLASHQLPYVTWAAGYYNSHPELAIRVVDRCPAGINCVVVSTLNLPYPVVGSTWVSTGSTPHLLGSGLRLDPDVGRNMSATQSRLTVFHEFCHALGGGFTPPGAASIHEFCNWKWRSLIFAEISRVYHNDPG